MKIFQNLSIKNKLVGIILSTSILAVILGLLIYGILDIINFKEEMKNNAILNARLVGEYSVAPLDFEYQDEAEEILLKLDALPDVLNACIYDKDNQIFASFNRSNEVEISFPTDLQRETEFYEGYLHIFHPIIYKNENYGTAYLRISTTAIDDKIVNNLIIFVILIIALFFPVFLLATRLQRIISFPVLKLADVTKEISEKRDYSLRVEPFGTDEIGILYNRFNKMFENIQLRESERDGAIKALKESEEKFRKIFESSHDAMMLLDENEFIDCNNATLRVFGCNTRDEFCGKHPREVSPPLQPDGKDSKQAADEQIAVSFREGSNFFEWTHRRINGEDFPAEVLLTTIEIEGRTIVQATVRDITARKKAEEEINFLAHTIRSISECISITDLDNNIMFINDAFLKTYGYEKHELIGKNIDIVRKEINPQEILEKIKPSSLKDGWQGELLNKRKDGSQFPIFLSTSVVRDEKGKPIALVGIATDISERRLIEDELRKHREHLEDLVKERTSKLEEAIEKQIETSRELVKEQYLMNLLMDSIPDNIYFKDCESKFIKINNATITKFGLSSDKDILGKTDYDLFGEEHARDAFEDEQRIIKTRNPVRNKVEKEDWPDGSITWVVTSKMPLKDENGNISGTFGITRDITEIKRAELALKEAKEKAEEADRMKSVFLANMSHELRTPLNSIIGFTGMILMGMVGDITKEQNKQLTMVKNSAQHLLNLINDILDISKIEAGKTVILPEEFNINDVVQEVMETVTPLVSKKEFDLVGEISEKIKIFSDRKRVKQILMNLVSNAVKFTDRGSVKIESKVLKNKNLEVRVIDTGLGIQKKDISKLFNFFQQVDMSSTKKHEGTGLGLYLSKKLVTMLGGDITVKSEYGKGSEFAFIIPLNYKEENK